MKEEDKAPKVAGRKAVAVPQGCYAEVRQDDNIILFAGSEKMGPCCHIVVANKNTGHFILCHADERTNLLDKDNGVPAWIKKVCPHGDYANLLINIGETQENPRPGMENAIYYSQVVQATQSIQELNGKNLQDYLTAKRAGNVYEIVVTKQHGKEPNIDPDAAFDEAIAYNINEEEDGNVLRPNLMLQHIRELHQYGCTQNSFAHQEKIMKEQSQGEMDVYEDVCKHLKQDAIKKKQTREKIAPICTSIGDSLIKCDTLGDLETIGRGVNSISISSSESKSSPTMLRDEQITNQPKELHQKQLQSQSQQQEQASPHHHQHHAEEFLKQQQKQHNEHEHYH